MKKRVLVISDTHCGHRVGLTPPPWWVGTGSGGHSQEKVAKIQREMWKWFERTVKPLRPIHTLIHAGDMVDGTGRLSGATEQLTTDREEQAKMAAHIIDFISPVNLGAVYGTGYHTGKAEDWESIAVNLAKSPAKKEIGSELHLDINGIMINVKHHIGGSQAPTGGSQQLKKEEVWDKLWSVHDQKPTADIIIRGHVHIYRRLEEAYFDAFTCHSLQGLGSKFGARRCSGIVTIGIQWIDIDDDGSYGICQNCADLQHQKASVVKF